ncbi:MAG: hypothetical protein ACJ8C4_14785 [Gemmataceae bacterium]
MLFFIVGFLLAGIGGVVLATGLPPLKPAGGVLLVTLGSCALFASPADPYASIFLVLLLIGLAYLLRARPAQAPTEDEVQESGEADEEL